MNEAMVIVLILFVVLLFTGLPLYVNLGLTSFLYIFLTGTPPMVVVQRITQASNSFTMIAAPFFILMGNLMNTGGVTRKMFRFANVLVGTVPGGMGHANVLCSALFAGMSGTAVADAGGLGNIEIQAMREVGYDDDFSCAVTAASSVLGPIIPPSLPMVILAVTVGASVGRCLVGAIIPGILIAVALCTMVAIYANKRHYPKNPRPTLRIVWVAFREAFLALMAPVILFAAIYTGVVTTTEAAIVAALYSMLIGLFAYKDTLNELFQDIDVRIMGTFYYGTRQLTANKPVTTLSDLSGMKIRVPQSDLYVKMVEAWGAAATPMNINELYMALQTGTVDAQENPLTTYESYKFYEVVKNVILTDHIICPNMIFINNDVWNNMSEHDQQVVQTAIDNAIAWQDEQIIQSEQTLAEDLKQYGVEVYTPDETIREATIPYIKPSIEDWDYIQTLA